MTVGNKSEGETTTGNDCIQYAFNEIAIDIVFVDEMGVDKMTVVKMSVAK
jgi:hypothetical protein